MEAAEGVRVIFEDAPEKFQPLAAETVPPFLALLEARNGLEREICARSGKCWEEKAAGISPHLSIPAEEELWEEFQRRYRELVFPRCTETMRKGGPARSFGKPARYGCLFGHPGPTVCATMKSPKKSAGLHPEPRAHGCRFLLRPSEGGWKVGGAECRLGSGQRWGEEHCL